MAIATRPLPQPIKAVLAMRRISVRQLSIEVGHPEISLGQVVNGRRRAPADLRRRLSQRLDLPEAALFTDGARS